jgi:hypothetical protein
MLLDGTERKLVASSPVQDHMGGLRVLEIRREGFVAPEEFGSKPQTSTALTLTISQVSWALPEQSVQARGASMSAGDAGALAVRMYGRALKKLADS